MIIVVEHGPGTSLTNNYHGSPPTNRQVALQCATQIALTRRGGASEPLVLPVLIQLVHDIADDLMPYLEAE